MHEIITNQLPALDKTAKLTLYEMSNPIGERFELSFN
jgi:hypothetical protein